VSEATKEMIRVRLQMNLVVTSVDQGLGDFVLNKFLTIIELIAISKSNEVKV